MNIACRSDLASATLSSSLDFVVRIYCKLPEPSVLFLLGLGLLVLAIWGYRRRKKK